MRKFYSLFIALLAVCGLAQAQVTFDFTADKSYELFGLTGYSDSNGSSAGDFTEALSATSGDVTITVSPSGGKNANRMWTGGSLRLYGGTLTFASSGKNISAIDFTLNNSKWGAENAADSGTLETGKWTGDAASVVITIAANTQIKSITVTLGDGEGGGGDDPVDPQPEEIDWTSSETAPLTVAQLQEKAAKLEGGKNSGKDVYVKGKISQIDEVSPKLEDGSGYGNATYYISDDGTTTNQFYVFRGKYLKGENFTSEDQIKVGDEVVVVGVIKNYVKGETSTLEFDQGNKLYSLNGDTGDDIPEPVVTEYTKIADLKTAATATKTDVVYKATDVLVTYVNGKSVYVYDGTDGLLLFGDNSGIKAGDKVTVDIKGQLYLYNGLTEIGTTAYENLTVNSSDNAVEAQSVTVADVNNNPKDYENELITIEALVPAAEALANRNITFTDDSDNELVVRDNFSVLTNVAFDTTTEYTVTGFVAIYSKNETTTVQIYPRTADDVDNGVVEPPYEFQGDGTFENPYTVEDLQHIETTSTKEAVETDVWVKAYIVGYINGSSLNESTAMFTADAPEGTDKDGNPLTVAVSNLLVADATSASTVADVIPVAIVAKSVARENLNLADNPEMLGQQVWLKGNIIKYMGVTGLKEVKEYSLNGEDLVTRINSLEEAAANAAIYTIAGQRLQRINRAGLYIVGGKKVVVK